MEKGIMGDAHWNRYHYISSYFIDKTRIMGLLSKFTFDSEKWRIVFLPVKNLHKN